MSLLIDDIPMSICRVGTTLMWDVDCDCEADEIFDISVSFKSILTIFAMLNGKSLIDNEKQWCMLRMFYLDNVPQNHQTAAEFASEFMQCGKGIAEPTRKEKPLYSWEQDGDYIYAAINQAFDGILDKEPDLHWWRFVNCFANCTDEKYRINEIICNRAAHLHPNTKKGIPTKEQKEARRLYPEIYILRENRKTDDETMNKAKELERLMNNKGQESCQ